MERDRREKGRRDKIPCLRGGKNGRTGRAKIHLSPPKSIQPKWADLRGARGPLMKNMTCQFYHHNLNHLNQGIMVK
jgi:hypothetical protein